MNLTVNHKLSCSVESNDCFCPAVEAGDMLKESSSGSPWQTVTSSAPGQLPTNILLYLYTQYMREFP